MTNLTLAKNTALSGWASVYVVPKENVDSFSIRAQVDLATDWWHPKNSVIKIIPWELVYNRTGTNTYTLLS